MLAQSVAAETGQVNSGARLTTGLARLQLANGEGIYL